MSVAVTFKSIFVDSLSPWSTGPVTITSYDPSVAMVTVITVSPALSSTVRVSPVAVKVVDRPLLVMSVNPGWSAWNTMVSIASEPTSNGI
ncbi:hypothetical protein P3TCK_06402 [Photobacterium profundum 3TCK]|uniref:Uncharacterized protein n=1 Tax=Photobacterium profundum 3TCK TaxID=314280 RepID=Q1Z6W1_9GAMM|nr:hypothetical protein P3TCK_06402 [Photobacterium profundum 3TCK]